MRPGIFGVVAVLVAGNVSAEDYDFEIGLAYDDSSTDTVSAATSGGAPSPSLGLTVGSSDSDTVSLFGRWYFDGLSDSKGPKSRAAFLSRASSVSLAYSHDDSSASSTFSGSLFPPISQSTSSTRDSFAVNLRYVQRDTGWFALAGVSRVELDFEGLLNGMSVSNDASATAYNLGVGKYFGEATTVALSVAQADTSGFDATKIGLSFAHIGSLGQAWQYGVDAAISRSDESNDEGNYFLRLSMYPSRVFEFGTAITYQKNNGGFDTKTYEGFASWFARDNVELKGRYGTGDFDGPPGTDADSDSFGIAVNVRF